MQHYVGLDVSVKETSVPATANSRGLADHCYLILLAEWLGFSQARKRTR
jgi:hypothetical protein